MNKATAAQVVGMIDMFGDACAAAHQIRVQLRAIRPYTDRGSDKALAILDTLANRADAERHIAKLRTIAA